MILGHTYKRTSPKGDTTFVTLNHYKEKEYQEDLEAEGYVFEEVTAPPGVCLSCEG